MDSKRISDYIKDPKNILLYHGTPGIGKSYMCAALIEWALMNFNHFRYYAEKDLLSKLRDGISEDKGDYIKHLESLIDDDLVILDDVGSCINPKQIQKRDLEWKREIFFNFLDIRYNNQLPTIITSNFSRKEFNDIFSPRICSRLFAKENTIIEIFDENLDKRKHGF